MVPAPFSALVGQTQAVTLLTQAVVRQRVAPGYLFVGAEGVGRALAAAAFAECLLTPAAAAAPPAALRRRIASRNHPDLLWVEPTYLHQGRPLTVAEAAESGLKRRGRPQIRLAQIREIARFLGQPPLEAARAVVVIEQAELMAEAAANGLLKTLEEPGRATVILITGNLQALLPTLVSRCQTVPFERLSAANLAQVLQQNGRTEILESAEILALAQGSPGAAIAHWQQQQALPDGFLARVEQLPQSRREALETAREIVQTLDTEAQLWLLDYLLQQCWQQSMPIAQLQQLEQARKYLLSYVQPRLVWETLLMQQATARSAGQSR
ncbi:MAG: DNA polymerase III subunit delta' [Leptolyngbya sp. SIO4C1]|nr:DNA polymerase III subunit delta' [Leptolyngbya sp. SIO4C1]